MIILLIGLDCIKAPFALALFMMAAPPCCASSFPTYTTFSPLCSVTDPRPFRLGLNYPYHFSPIPFHLLGYLPCPCCVRHGPHILATNGRLSLGGYYGALSDFRLPTGFDSRSSLQPQQQHPSSVLSRHQCLRFL